MLYVVNDYLLFLSKLLALLSSDSFKSACFIYLFIHLFVSVYPGVDSVTHIMSPDPVEDAGDTALDPDRDESRNR